MTTERVKIFEDDKGTFFFQCPNCGFTKRTTSPKIKKFKINCKCGTGISAILNTRAQNRKKTDINAHIMKKNLKENSAETKVKGVLTSDSNKIYVVIIDMSIFGLKCYFNSNLYRLNIGEKIIIEYTINSKSKKVNITDHCTVKWIKEDYFGVQCYKQTRKFD